MPDLEIAQLQRRYAGLRVMDPGHVSRLAAASIAKEGQRSPVLVVGDVLIDGYHRVQALEELGRDLVTGVHIELTEADALVLAWRLETGRRKTAIEERRGTWRERYGLAPSELTPAAYKRGLATTAA